MNKKYSVGTLLQTRTSLEAKEIETRMPKTKLINTRIPDKEIVVLLEHIMSFGHDDVALLWNNKILFCMDIDLEHNFKILSV